MFDLSLSWQNDRLHTNKKASKKGRPGFEFAPRGALAFLWAQLAQVRTERPIPCEEPISLFLGGAFPMFVPSLSW